MGSNLREALDTLLVALLAKALLDAELRLGRVDERAFDRRGDDRDATRALELADEWQQRGLAHLAGHVDLAEEQHLWSPVLRVERNLLELEERLRVQLEIQRRERTADGRASEMERRCSRIQTVRDELTQAAENLEAELQSFGASSP